jgi:hypothetical protein
MYIHTRIISKLVRVKICFTLALKLQQNDEKLNYYHKINLLKPCRIIEENITFGYSFMQY